MMSAALRAAAEARQDHHSIRAWRRCHDLFGEPPGNADALALQLGFFLGAWGMMRGSSQLRLRDYTVHIDAVKLVTGSRYLKLRRLSATALGESVADLMDLREELAGVYCAAGVEPTDTLITKIMHATLCCTPAYDRFATAALGQLEEKVSRGFSTSGLNGLARFCRHRLAEIAAAREMLRSQPDGYDYPDMRIVDMYLWSCGEYLERKKKAAAAGI